ncbi:MAG: uridine kinase [Clostridiales bacterium]|jgi:uridine kinase|nr:uridine kinase [Clostridiales bacterium]MDN5280920.1 uridine kinase [Candidatus Ozemobacter sp.]
MKELQENKVEEISDEKEMLTITINDGTSHKLEHGHPISELLDKVPQQEDLPYICAKIQNDIHSLDFVPEMDCRVEFLNYKSPHGRDCYRRSLTLVLARAVMELYRNARLAIDHSIGNGFYYDLFTDVPVSEKILEYIKTKMLEIVKKDEKFGKKTMTRSEAIALLNREGYPEKARLLKNLNTDKVGIISCWKYIDLDFGPMVPSTGYLEVFDLKQYAQGFVLLFPDNNDPGVPSEVRRQPKIFQAYRESKNWGKILEVNNVGRLNETIKDKTISDFIKTAEALHSKKIQEIADEITRRTSCRIVLIAGPSSSGKTTFSKRLCTHLKVNGLRPVALSLDNYFLDRAHTPRDEDGEYDFESIYALDLELFNKHLKGLLEGHTVQIPEFDFHTGHRKTETDPMRINEDQIIIIEGIHGLNDELTSSIPASCKFKIYISALTQLVIDDYNRIATTDTRLIRRTVRDSKYRGYSAEDTINRWESVRRGEERNIFPFQECADMVFNSAVPYEWAVLRPIAEPLFLDIPPESSSYPMARRILKTLSFFSTLDPKEVPPTSILREFIGGSSFQY